MHNPNQTRLARCLALISILAILTFIILKAREISAYRYNQFQQGQEAYKSANCQKASLLFLKLERTASFPFNNGHLENC